MNYKTITEIYINFIFSHINNYSVGIYILVNLSLCIFLTTRFYMTYQKWSSNVYEYVISSIMVINIAIIILIATLPVSLPIILVVLFLMLIVSIYSSVFVKIYNKKKIKDSDNKNIKWLEKKFKDRFKGE